jgi:hypothetical protein
MQRFLTSLALTFALALHASPSVALGFGKVSGAATLGQALHFSVAVRVEASESLEPACVKTEVTAGDRILPSELVRVRVDALDAATGERRLHVLTTTPLDEPVIGIALKVGCPASLSRSFVVFADPPVRNAAAADNVPLPPERVESPLSTWVASLPGSPAASAPAPRNPPARARKAPPVSSASAPAGAQASRQAAASTPVAAAPPAAPRVRRSAAVPKPAGGSVLRLDPVEAEALVLPTLRMATTLGQAPDPASGASAPRYIDPEVAQRMREQERLKALDDALVRLRTDNQATQKALADMQARVRDAEAGRFSNPLVYALVLLCVLFAAAAAGLWWLRRRDRQNASWWSAQEEGAGGTPAAAPLVDEQPQAMPDELPPPFDMPAPRPEIAQPAVVSAPMPMMSLPTPLRSAEPTTGMREEPRRPMSAEELIDLEQQAEFFVVLGQDDAAIDLLMGHVRSTGGVSPLPYLKLLEIYRRRGEREAYDRIRERFNRRFNAYAPEWEVDPEQGLSLDGYPEVLKRLQNAWSTPSQAMELLDASLFRRDAGPTFDVPAYRELLFLYSMARDLAERDLPVGAVDLLLPIGDDAAPAMTTIEASPVPPPVDAHFSLDFDLSSDPPPNLSLEDRDFKRKTR